MKTDLDGLVALHLAGICGLGYGARQIVRGLHEKNVPIGTIVVSGGAGQSPLVRQHLADATGKVVAAPLSPDLRSGPLFRPQRRHVVHVGNRQTGCKVNQIYQLMKTIVDVLGHVGDAD